MKKKPVVLMDANLLCWMAGQCGSTKPRRFDLKEKKEAFYKLLKLREKGIIDIAVSDRHVEEFKKANKDRPELRRKIGEHFNKKISIKHNFVFQGSELDQNEEKIFPFITNGKEMQDDPELFLLSDLTDPSITHVASCDSALPAKFKAYNNMLKKKPDLMEYRDFRRRNTKVYCGLPSEVFENLKEVLGERLF